ncbi:MAG: ABC transporter permease [Candidatus Marinimicrobia bacterium]|nr:ABC transporter permease [Candidatus Neomarinimicrobiota bacterium]
MNILPVFIRRRFWLLRRQWFGEIAMIFLIPIFCYLSFGLGIEYQFGTTIQGHFFRSWIIPGILFVVILIASTVSIFTDFSHRENFQGLGNMVASTPHSHLSLVTCIVLSLFPEIIVKTIVAGFILFLITGIKLNILHFIGLLIFCVILGFFCINLFLTILLLSKRSISNAAWILGISLLLIFTSGWIIPYHNYPQSISNIFSYLPTTLLGEGGRKVFLTGEILWKTGLVPLIVSIGWLFVNSVLFKKEILR